MKKITKKKRRIILLLAALLLLIAAAMYTVLIAPLLKKEEWIYKEATVERGTLTVGVTESGTLDYGITTVLYDLDLDVSDDEEDDDDDDEETTEKYLEIEEVCVAAGQRISAGDALIKFTEESVTNVRRLLQNALVEAKAEYSEAESTYQLSLLEAQTDYEANQIEGKYAQSIYTDAKTAVTNEITSLQVQINQCNANVASLEEKLAEAEEDYAEALEDYNEAKEGYELYKDTDNISNFFVYQSTYLSALSKYQNAKSAREQAQQNLTDNAEKLVSLQTELAAASGKKQISELEVKQTYDKASLNSKNAEISYQAKLESLKEDLEDAEEDKKELEEKLEAFEAFVGEDGILYAEAEGIVTESSYEAGDELKQTGTLVSYAQPQNMTISVDVAQEDVVDLSVGDEVEIEFTSYEGEIYSGSILSVDTTSTAANSNTVSYTVVISVGGDTSKLYGGMAADVTFVTEQKEDVLYVSRKAIVSENGKSYVYRKTALGGKELTEVETGITNGSSIEILSGLVEGDTIYIASKVSSTSEVKSTEQSGSSAGTDSSTGTASDMPQMDGSGMPGGGNMPGSSSGSDNNGGGFSGGMRGGAPGGGGRSGQGSSN